MHDLPAQRYAGAVLPPAIAILAALGLIAPIGELKDGTPIWPMEGGDGTASSPTVTAGLDRLRARRNEALTAAQALVDTATTESRDLTADEFTTIAQRNADVSTIDRQIAELETLQQRSAAAAEQRQRLDRAIGPTVQVTRNEAAYRQGGEHSFVRDILATRQGDPDAFERLRRNNEEGLERERRDGTSTSATSMGSFIPPVWLLDHIATKARVGRVLAPFLVKLGAPTTTSYTDPRITTGSAAAGQAGDNAAVTETDIVTAQLARTTATIAGQQDVSIQSMDLSPFPVDQLILSDLASAYQQELDRQILRGSGTNELLGINQVASINTVTYTDGSPTAAELYPKFGDAMQKIHSNRFAPAQLVSMSPRRWAWISTAVDTTGRPLGIPAGNAAFNPIATFGEVAAQGIVGMLSNGLPVVATGSHATDLGGGTEDQIVVFRPDDILFFESPLRTRIHEQTLNGTLTVRLQVFAYVNMLAGAYPASISTIGGTGLAAPTF